MGQVPHFLGIKFMWKHLPEGHLSISLTQQSFLDTLLTSLNITIDSSSHYSSPYKAHCHIDSISHQEMSASARDSLCTRYPSLIGSLNWLAHTTRTDISTIVSLLAQYQSTPSHGHYDAALYVAKYLATTKTMSIYFTSTRSSIYNFLFNSHCFPCLMPIGAHRLHPSQKHLRSYLCLFHALCLLFTLIFLVLSIGYQNANLSLQVVLPRPKSTRRMSVSNSFWNSVNFWSFLVSGISSCLLLIL
jgi:hypothetical protein